MCLVVVALDAHPRYRRVVVANRDEWHVRATARAAWWPEGILAGRDLVAGGTWLGVTRAGRAAMLTNVREPARHDPRAPSRGPLVTRALASTEQAAPTIARLLADGTRYNGFNIVVLGPDGAAWGSNRHDEVAALPPGVHGLSNARLDVRWPKVARLMDAVSAWCARGDDGFDPLWDALADRTIAPDAELPSTGVTLAWERMLSAPFIVGDEYGTRSSTIVAIDAEGRARFVERSFGPLGRPDGEVDEGFEAGAPRAAAT